MMVLSHNKILRLTLAASLLASLAGCSNPPSFSDEANDIVLALYTTCKHKNQEKLDALLATTEAALAESKITEKEALIIQGIIAMAGHDGEWAEAARLSREFLDSQVKGP